MKIAWKPVIITAVVLVVCFGAWRAAEGIAGLWDNLQGQVTEVRELADQAADAVSADWDPAALEPFARPEYVAGLDPALWANYRALGARTALEPCTVPNLKIQNGRGVAQASCKASFEKGAASLIMNFDNTTGEWKIATLQLLL